MKHISIDIDNISKDELIELKKAVRSCVKQGRMITQHKTCILCGAEGKICDSHTVPKVFLNTIKDSKGHIIPYKSILNSEVFDENCGINNAGVFRMICQKCDNELFQDYENATSYNQENYAQQVANQIALKNYLSRTYHLETEVGICKELNENSAYTPSRKEYMSQFSYKRKTELKYLCNNIDYSYNNIGNCFDGRIHSFKIDYIVPIAFQGAIPLITGLDGEIINDLYSEMEPYAYLHIAVFPLKNSTVILLFADINAKKYDLFFESLMKLSNDRKTEVIYKIIMWYAKDFYISGSVDGKILEWLAEMTAFSPDVVTSNPHISLNKSLNDFDLRRDVVTVNLFDKEYSLDSRD